jgi:mannose-6-phosphate isomerase
MKDMTVSPFFVDKPWGGYYISEVFKLPIQRMIGEALLISTLDSQENFIGEEKLSAHLGSSLPYVIKLIDANENLSIQVHPNDFFAEKLENSTGKTECWLIADCKEGAGVYYGLKKDVSIQNFFEQVAENNNVASMLNFVPVKKNDFIIVPSGTIHAIGAGVRLIEYQQSSGITYRIWDWGREGRELHIGKALEVSNENQNYPEIINFEDVECNSEFFKHSDFRLMKESNNFIHCSSDKSNVSVKFDIRNFTFSLSKT